MATLNAPPDIFNGRRQYYSGICRCGHSFQEHHLGAALNDQRFEGLPPDHPQRVAEECEAYDVNEGGGMGLDGRDHCHHYIDKDDPRALTDTSPGSYTRGARAMMWLRALGHCAVALTTGKRYGYDRRKMRKA